MGRFSIKRAIFETLFVIALAGAYVVAELCGIPKRWIIPGVGLAITGYLIFIIKSSRESLRDFGLRLDNLRTAAIPNAVFTLAAAAGIIVWALATGTPLWKPELAVLLPLYPLYGIAQQFIFQGVLHRRLMRLLGGGLLPAALTAVIFGLVHLGDARLVALTIAAGFAWSLIFRKYPNVLACGISHGLLASLVYPLILGDNLLSRI